MTKRNSAKKVLEPLTPRLQYVWNIECVSITVCDEVQLPKRSYQGVTLLGLSDDLVTKIWKKGELPRNV